MKVLVISHTYIAPVNREKWNVLAKLFPDLSITVICPKQWPGVLFTHTADHTITTSQANCSFIALEVFKEGNELLYGYYPHQLFSVIKHVQPTIIHVEQGASAFSYFQTLVTTKLLRLKTKVLFFTWINWRPTTSFKHRLLWGWITKFNLKNSHGAITGNAQAKALLQEDGFTKPVLVLPQLGVDQHVYTPTTAHTEKTTITYVGRLVEEKGIFLLLGAFSKLAHLFPKWHLQFVGSGTCKQQLIDAVRAQLYANRITVQETIPHEKIPKLLQQSSILVLPSYDTSNWREQFGHVLIEAMACGIPVVGSDAGEIPHVIADAGLIFEQKNEASLLAQLHALMQDDQLRMRFGEKGRKRVECSYSHEAIAQQTYAYWQQLLNA